VFFTAETKRHREKLFDLAMFFSASAVKFDLLLVDLLYHKVTRKFKNASRINEFSMATAQVFRLKTEG